MRKWVISFVVILFISIFLALAWDNPLAGIGAFALLSIFAVIVNMEIGGHEAKPMARKLLKQDKPNEADLQKCITSLSGASDEESKELIRKLVTKREERHV